MTKLNNDNHELYLSRTFKARAVAIMVSLFLTVFATPIFADTTDLLQNARGTVTANFGANSTFFWLLLIAEVIVVSLNYIRTHDPKAWIGIPILWVATAVVWTMLP